MLKIFPVYFHTCSHKYVENIYYLHSQAVKMSVMCVYVCIAINWNKQKPKYQHTMHNKSARKDEDVLTEIPMCTHVKINTDSFSLFLFQYIRDRMKALCLYAFVYVCLCTARGSWAVCMVAPKIWYINDLAMLLMNSWRIDCVVCDENVQFEFTLLRVLLSLWEEEKNNDDNNKREIVYY